MVKKWFYRFKNKWSHTFRKIPQKILPIPLLIILTIVVIFLYFINYIPLLTLNGAIVTLIVSIIVTSSAQSAQKRQIMLTSIIARYLLEKDESYIDEALGILISGKLKNLKIDPIEELFGTIKRLSKQNDDYEIRRRIAEALPALYQIDLEKSKELFEIIRIDWDIEWKSDNRRRVIESLCYLIEEDKEFVKKNIHIIEEDEIFTIIALVELLEKYGEKTSWDGTENRFHEIIKELTELKYSSDEIQGISELWEILYSIRYNPYQAIKKLEDLKDSPNIYIQICIARNLNRLCKKFPERTLNLMGFFIQENKHKNVRRPIAKENSIECLIRLFQNKRFSEKAKEIFWKLINDGDDIIRLATFDKIENVLDIDNEFGKKILQHVVERNGNSRLVKRASIILNRQEGGL